uniref:phosphopyruvate hydratase n=1 Tax=Solanum lycopersicum TaxID=4081 RepID=A0A3Q7H411_SOLLC
MIIFTGLRSLSVKELQVSLHKHIADLSGQTSPLLPVPVFTLISGGKHGGNNLAIQEIMILPVGSNTFEEALQMGSETYHHLKAVITETYGAHGCNVGEDGGFTPNISRQVLTLRDGLDLVQKAIGRTGYNEKIKIAIGVAATEFCIGTKYDLDFKTPNKSGQNFKSGQDMIDMYKELCADYPIVSIEDPFDKEDWEHVKYFSSLGICQVVGGDLIMSNPKRIERAIQENSCNALLLKVPTDICWYSASFFETNFCPWSAPHWSSCTSRPLSLYPEREMVIIQEREVPGSDC